MQQAPILYVSNDNPGPTLPGCGTSASCSPLADWRQAQDRLTDTEQRMTAVLCPARARPDNTGHLNPLTAA